MIERVANAWSMLQAVQLSIGSQKREQELVAAALPRQRGQDLQREIADGRLALGTPAC
jgi:hypothetical protein